MDVLALQSCFSCSSPREKTEPGGTPIILKTPFEGASECWWEEEWIPTVTQPGSEQTANAVAAQTLINAQHKHTLSHASLRMKISPAWSPAKACYFYFRFEKIKQTFSKHQCHHLHSFLSSRSSSHKVSKQI